MEVINLKFEEDDPMKRRECGALTSNLEGNDLNYLVREQKSQYQKDSVENLFMSMLNCFVSGVQGHLVKLRNTK